MRCFTLEKGLVTPGIQLWQDPDGRCFVHVRPDIWMPVHHDLLNCTSLDAIERRVDGQIIVHKASTHVITNHVVEFIPETADSALRACVLGHFGLDVARFTAACPQPSVPYRTVLGLNNYTRQVMATRRITHDKVGADARALDHEEYSFVVGMDALDEVRVHVLFYPAGSGLPSGQIDPWVEGTFLRYDGKDVVFKQIEARSLAQRFSTSYRSQVKKAA